MVRKNVASDIEKHTSVAFGQLTSTPDSQIMSPSMATMKVSLDTVCQLTGIGPATGTLILNIFDPVNVPFFQDEMYAWFFPNESATLKYTRKEYFRLVEEVPRVLTRLSVKAVEVEKVSYVLGHLELLDSKEREELESMFDNIEEASAGKRQSKGTTKEQNLRVKTSNEATENENTASVDPMKTTMTKRGRKRAKGDAEDDQKTSAAKRRPQHKR